jgi:diguanylate cyclase (GGDEF)-like protein/PAS domain S-box-containing protein
MPRYPLNPDLPAKLMLDSVLDALPIGLFWKDRDSVILGCNRKFAEDSGAADPADMIGKTNFDFYPPAEAEAYRIDDLEVITTGKSKLAIEEPLLLATGETAWVETNKVPLRNNAGEVIGVIGTYRDVTEVRRAQAERIRLGLELAAGKQAATMAMHDTLTGLPNRRYLQEKLRASGINAPPAERLAVISMDLDRFKAINDLYGHAVGDELLQKVSRLLSEQAGPEDFIARVGGDEFILLLAFESDADLIRQISALIGKFDAPISLGEHEVTVGATFGVAIRPTDGVDPDVLTRRSDMALYRAKQQGGAQFAFFEPGIESLAQERLLLKRDLSNAVKNDQIVPYFQPLVQLKTGHVFGYEVLARWPHAERGLVQPIQFIKIAEESGLIDTLTINLLRRACRETLHWPGSPRIGINIAPVQLQDAALPQKLLMVLSECGFPPARLEIEITEDALVYDIKTAKASLTSLKNLGVRVALDDFGIGYSSLKHLLDLPFDVLKIDRSFVQSMTGSEDAFTIVKAIVQLAKNLGLEVTAEGIETESQALALQALGCEQGQGFLLGRPLPAADRVNSPSTLADENQSTIKIRGSRTRKVPTSEVRSLHR